MGGEGNITINYVVKTLETATQTIVALTKRINSKATKMDLNAELTTGFDAIAGKMHIYIYIFICI
jgi:hypothetical protein